MQRRRLFLAASAALAAAALSACGRSGMPITRLPQHEVQGSAREIRAAILSFARGHGYQIEKETGRSITMRYPAASSSRGQGFFARYRVDYGQGFYRIVFVESQGMNETEGSGARTGHRKIDQWQRQMDRGIAAALQRR